MASYEMLLICYYSDMKLYPIFNDILFCIVTILICIYLKTSSMEPILFWPKGCKFGSF